MTHSGVVKSGEITGVKVLNATHEDLGDIAEVVIDKLSGKVNYLVLDFGGFLGFGNKFFAVPWNRFHYDKNEDCFILDVDKQRLQDAPGFDKDHWPDFASPTFSSSINQYYNS
ncbi:MAG: photosystem reaction center subunit H [Legionella sp. 40-6]|nr:PRC-barrel domain-containing protein [Legionella sp.]OJY42442.1 MAG: photosystem reaction center subunit H [Legionella sp. 40-6]